MKLEFPHKEGDIVTICDDYEHNSKVLGTAKLVKLISLGRSFILEDMYPEDTQLVYNYQEWLVEWLTPEKFIKRSKHKIRYLDTIGIANSTEDTPKDDELELLMKDTFIKINGIEVY